MNTPSVASVLLELAADFEARGEATRQPSPLGPQTWNPSGTVLTSEGAAWCSAANLLRMRAAQHLVCTCPLEVHVSALVNGTAHVETCELGRYIASLRERAETTRRRLAGT